MRYVGILSSEGEVKEVIKGQSARQALDPENLSRPKSEIRERFQSTRRGSSKFVLLGCTISLSERRATLSEISTEPQRDYL